MEKKEPILNIQPKEKKYGMLMCMKLIENILSCGYEDGSLLEWDLRKPDQLWNSISDLYEEGDHPILCMDGNKNMMLIGSTPNQPIIQFKRDDIKKHLVESGVNDISIRRDHGMIASAGWDGKIRIFSPKMKPITILKHHLESVHCLDFSLDHSTLASGSKDQRIALWNVDFK
jgi:WD40 repeat protein